MPRELAHELTSRTDTSVTTGLAEAIGLEMAWWKSGRWAASTAIWLCLENSFLMVLLLVSYRQVGGTTSIDTALSAFPLFASLIGLLTPIGAVLMAHDRMLGEANSGTAGWLMSLPISQEAYALAKVCGVALVIFGTMIFPQAVIAYGQFSWVARVPLPMGPYIGAWSLFFLNMLVYALLSMAIGALTKSRSAALGICLALILLGLAAGDAGPVARWLPWQLPNSATSLIISDVPFDPIVPLASLIWLFLATLGCIVASRRNEY